MLQELRLAFGAGAHRRETDAGAMPDREDVIFADEDVHFADQQLFHAFRRLDPLDRVQHGEQRIAVFFDLRTLMTAPRVVDGEIVQAELLGHLVQLLPRRVDDRDPDEAVRPLHVFADILDRDIGELAAVFVSNAADQHGAESVG